MIPSGQYQEIYNASINNPEEYWLAMARQVDWFQAPSQALDASQGAYGRWFPDATCNTCYNALDRHVRDGRGEQCALIYDSPVTGQKRAYDYSELKEEVSILASVLRENGVSKGDRVVIYMPMIPEAVIAMLACARLGAVHCVTFGGFASKELANRIDDALPKIILAASCGIETSRIVEYKPLLDEAIRMSLHKPDQCLILQRQQVEAALISDRDLDWGEEVSRARRKGASTECEVVAATDPLYILYTSGTTGKPKGVVRDNGGHLVALMATMSQLYDVKPGDVIFTASDIGWVVGHSYIVYGPLVQGATTVLYEGKPVGTPDPGAYWRVIAEHEVATFFTAPTALRAIRKEDPEGTHCKRYNLSKLRALFLAGERADTDTLGWASELLQIPVIDHWWQTESGTPIVGNPLGLDKLPIKYGSPSVPLPGWRVECVDEASAPVNAGKMGTIVLRLPLPPGALPTLWNDDRRFIDGYLTAYPGYYNTSDAGYFDDEGYVFIMGRTDDIINVAGHRLSTGVMEEILSSHSAVAECAVVGIPDNLKGEQPCGFVVLKGAIDADPRVIENQLVAMVREQLGPVASFKIAVILDRLPKTRSGKILRATIKRIANGHAPLPPATIDDVAALYEVETALINRGVLKTTRTVG